MAGSLCRIYIDNIITCSLVPKSVLEMLARTLVKMTLEVQCSSRRMEGEIEYSINFLRGQFVSISSFLETL